MSYRDCRYCYSHASSSVASWCKILWLLFFTTSYTAADILMTLNTTVSSLINKTSDKTTKVDGRRKGLYVRIFISINISKIFKKSCNKHKRRFPVPVKSASQLYTTSWLVVSLSSRLLKQLIVSESVTKYDRVSKEMFELDF